MSQYFQVDDRVLWNPSSGVSRLFMRTAEALAPEAGLPTGLGPMVDDECEIDLTAFTAFVSALVQRCERSNHPILRSLMEGFIATALVLVQRGGATPSVSGGRDESLRDIQVGPHAERSPSLGVERWAALVAQHAEAMPR
jgi:hypothetical protein